MDHISQPLQPKPIDFSSLSRPVTPEDVQRYDAWLTQGRAPTKSLFLIIPKALKAVWAALLVLTILQLLRGVSVENMTVALMLLVGTGALWVLMSWQGRVTKRRQARLWHFAHENSLTYKPNDMARGEQGILFSQTQGSNWTDIIAEPSGAYEIGRYEYVTGSGRHQTTHNWVYMRARLDRALPHMVLDAKGNNFFGFSNLPMMFKKDQTLSLEGNFDKIFTLYAPKNYERDALYIFTPDLMALLVDEAVAFDAEIIDDQIYFYAKRKIYDQSEYMQQMFTIIEKIGQKMDHRVKNYEDDRAEASVNSDSTIGVIAPDGRRLKRGVPWFLLVGAGLIILVQAWPYIISTIINILRP